MIKPISFEGTVEKVEEKGSLKKASCRSANQDSTKTFINLQNKSKKFSEKSLKNTAITAQKRLNNEKSEIFRQNISEGLTSLTTTNHEFLPLSKNNGN